MSDSNGHGPVPIEALPHEDLVRLLKRANFVKEQQASRIGSVLTENLEMLGVIQEQQVEIEELKAKLAVLAEPTNTPEQPGEVLS